MVYVLIVILIIFLALFIVGIRFTNIAMYPKILDYNNTYIMEIENGNINKEEYEKLPKEEFYIQSQFGYKLHAIWFPNKESKKTIVLVHGITLNVFGSIKYMNIFYKRGFNVLVYDHRFHGRSGGPNCTFGYYEKYDLKACIDWVLNKAPSNSIVGTLGESMGAATALQHVAIDDRLAFVIADCPYKSALEEFKYRLKIEYKLPSFPVIYIASLVNKLRTKAYFSEMSPISGIKNINTPILFVHGDVDTYIPASHSIDMYNLKSDKKMLYLAPGATHAKALITNKNEYEKIVNEFLNKFTKDMEIEK